MKHGNRPGASPETALYCRVSTDAQAEEGYSIEAQQKALVGWCQSRGIERYAYYVDGGFSGSSLDRPEMKRLIDDVAAGKIKTVVVYKLDRISRSQKDTLYLIEDVFNRHGCAFVSLQENLDTNSSFGRAIIGILSAFAQLERENIRERTRMGMLERVKAGYWMGGGTAPYGYRYDAGSGVLTPDRSAENVAKIYELYLQGVSTAKLAAIFGFKGDKQIMDILSRETYRGVIRYNGALYEGRHTPLVSEELWEKVRQEKKRRSVKSAVSSPYLLTGLVYCGKCGAKMRYQKWGGDEVKLYCYSQQTSKPKLVKDPDCDNMRIDAFALERLVVEDLLKKSDETVPDGKARGGLSVLEELKLRREQLSAKIKRLYHTFAETDNVLLTEVIRENQDELERIQNDIDSEQKIQAITAEKETRRSEIKNLKTAWPHLTVREKQQVLRLYIRKIVVTDNNVDIIYDI